MRKLMLLLAVAAAAAVVLPQTALGGTSATRGVVVARSGKLLAVASPSGAVHTARTNSTARIGARVKISGVTVRVLGRARSAHIRGTVVRNTSRQLVIAAGRSLITLRAAGRRLAGLGQTPGTAAPGTTVDTTAAITGTQLNLMKLTSTGGSVATIEIQATVKAFAPGVITLDVSGKSIAFGVPAGLDLSGLVGKAVTLTINLTGISPIVSPGGQQDDDDDEDEGEDDD